MINFRIDSRSAVPPYLQIAQQVRQALRMGVLEVGDKLPTVREVVAATAVNPNTVLKAYRELEYQGLAAARPGRGTFITGTLSGASVAAQEPLRRELNRWLGKARRSGMDEESIEALFLTTFRSTASSEEDIA